MKSKERSLLLIFSFLVFSFFFIFFFYLHPISISDTDDWIFLTTHRDAYPIWGAWNPCRVFAEVTFPVISSASATLFYPVTGNIFISLTIGYAICMAASVTALAVALWRLDRKKHSVLVSITVSLFFLICHFWIFRTEYQDNDYMLRTNDACSVFFYIIPNLLNAVLVLWMETDNEIVNWSSDDNQYQFVKKTLFIILAYFSIFSNIWAGMILAVYIGTRLLFTIKPIIQGQKKLNNWFGENKTFLILFAVWIASQFFEMNGGRAADIMIGKKLSGEIVKTIITMLRKAAEMNWNFVATMLLLLLAGISVQIARKKKSELKKTMFWGTCFLFSCVYLILSCSKTGQLYAARPGVFYGLFFFGFMTVVVNTADLADAFPKTKVFIPLLMIIALNDCFSGGRTFRDFNIDLSPRIINNINNDIVDQMVKAENAGVDHISIEVPVFDHKDNWPYAVYARDAIGESLWKFHVIEQNIKVDSIIPCSEKNNLLSIGTRSAT